MKRLTLCAFALFSLIFTAHAQTQSCTAPSDLLTINPTKPLNTDNVIDTLATADDHISVVLFNDNTWRYVQTKPISPDSTIFTKYWNEQTIFPYYNVPLSSLPETIPIQLVDSLQAYHYPYKGYITSRFGMRNGRRHAGIDIALKTGDNVYATFNGKVRYSRYHENGYGGLVIIRHDNGLETFHAHLSKRLVEAGERVVAGQVIGLGGSTGRSSGPHLHFECRYMGQSFDPERLIDFKTGKLRRAYILLKRNYFSAASKYEQDWNGEKAATEVEKEETTTSTATAKPQPKPQPKPKPKPKPKPQPKPVYHTIASGDYLGAIANRYKTTVKEICRLNNMKETDTLKIGRVLRVK